VKQEPASGKRKIGRQPRVTARKQGITASRKPLEDDVTRRGGLTGDRKTSRSVQLGPRATPVTSHWDNCVADARFRARLLV